MDAEELAQLIEELENRVERLRAVYDQYFMGAGAAPASPVSARANNANGTAAAIIKATPATDFMGCLVAPGRAKAAALTMVWRSKRHEGKVPFF